ncbi:ABC transporter ATP-binding protein [Bauldia sp.]|uniref:ABC transporter ATP-binding protein n=1 Tax=Bauldia sp. TaxID=2575872 RepID=UPI003BA876E7
MALLEVENLKVHYPGPRSGPYPWSRRVPIKAVDGVSLTLHKGKTLGLVGESGCGKSTLGRAIAQLTPINAGSVRFDGVDLVNVPAGDLRRLRRRLQLIFQDPYASLDPRRSIGFQVGEPLLLAGETDSKARQVRVRELLEIVGLDPALENRYPHEFSGGQRQRVGIARALATRPSLVLADEPVSALDVSIQAQVINLLRDLREQFGLSILFISHDLRVVRYVSDVVAVMYLGRIVEIAPVEEVFASPKHPYSQALLSAVPRPAWEDSPAPVKLEGEVPSPIDLPRGCAFATRCPIATEACHATAPSLDEKSPGHFVACIHVD